MKTGAFWRNIDPHRRTTPARVVKGLGAGALAGAALVTGAYALMFLSAGSLAYFPILLLVFPVAQVVWAIGLCAIAGLGWWILHVIGARSPFAGMAYGGTLCTVLGMAVALFLPLSIAPADQGHKVLSTPITETGWLGVAPGILLFAATGVAVGWVVHQVAYGRQMQAAGADSQT